MDHELHLPAGTLRPLPSRRPGPRGWWRGRRELRAAREEADAALLHSVSPAASTVWRAAEVTSEANRRAVARSIRRLVKSADARYLPGATPVNRLAVRQAGETLQAFADLLSDMERPVTARGVLFLDRLLKDGYGPLYVSYRAGELRWALSDIAELLEPAH